MRIVAHNGARIWGGAERATVSLLRGLGSRGHDVLLLCNSELVAQRASEMGVEARICLIGGDLSLHHAWRIKRALLKEKPDAFIVGTYKKLFLASWGAKKAGVPRVVARVGLESDTPRSLKYRIALRRWTDGVVVNANRMMSAFTALAGLEASRVRVIWNSVDADDRVERTSRVRTELGIEPSAFVVGAVARLSIQKRLDRLLHAVALLEGVHCIIAGSGTYRADLENLANDLNIADRTHLIGERDDVSDVLDALDVYAITSSSEGMSNAMLEAMSRGLPVISTRVSGAEDALAPDASGKAAGLIVDFSIESISTAVETLRADSALMRALGQEARERALSRFSRERMLSEWEDFLRPG